MSKTPRTDLLEDFMPQNDNLHRALTLCRTLETECNELADALELLLTCFGDNSDFAEKQINAARAALRKVGRMK